jgi:transposase
LVFEQAHGERAVVDLSETLQKKQAQAFIGRFEDQNQKKMAARIKQLLAVKGKVEGFVLFG